MSDGFTSALSHLIDQSGGVGGLLQRVQQGGLGDLVSSWVGTGPNAAPSPNQLHEALGQDAVSAAAQHGGISTGDMLRQMGQYLPQLIDHLSPDGHLPHDSGGLADMARNFLRNR